MAFSMLEFDPNFYPKQVGKHWYNVTFKTFETLENKGFLGKGNTHQYKVMQIQVPFSAPC